MSEYKELISLNHIIDECNEYRDWCKKNGYNPEFITYRFEGDELVIE